MVESTETKCITKVEGEQRQLALPSKLRTPKPWVTTQVWVARASQNNKANLMNLIDLQAVTDATLVARPM
jgi:hypothetical protein